MPVPSSYTYKIKICLKIYGIVRHFNIKHVQKKYISWLERKVPNISNTLELWQYNEHFYAVLLVLLEEVNIHWGVFTRLLSIILDFCVKYFTYGQYYWILLICTYFYASWTQPQVLDNSVYFNLHCVFMCVSSASLNVAVRFPPGECQVDWQQILLSVSMVTLLN